MEITNENGSSVAHLSGEIDHHNARQLREELDRHIINQRPTELVMDMSAITFMDSSGIGLIMGRCRLMNECGGKLTVQSPQPYIKRVLYLSGIERIVTIV